MRGEAWSKERDAKLTKLRDRGYSSTQIAVELGGVTRNGVSGRAMRLGLSKKRAGMYEGKGKHKHLRAPAVRLENHGNYFKVANDVPPPVPAIDQQSDNPVTLLDLEPHHCRWPVQDAPYLFCADAKQDGSSYCSRHFSTSRRGVAS